MILLMWENKLRRGFAIAISALLLLAAPVRAEVESSTGAQTAAPENPAKMIDLLVSPVGLAFGIPGGNVQVGIARSVTIGALINWYQNETRTRFLDTFELAGLVSIYLSGERFHDGWVLQPGLIYAPINIRSKLTNVDSVDRNTFLLTTIGYEWDWSTGFNIHLGAGMTVGLQTARRDIQPQLTWQLGWAF